MLYDRASAKLINLFYHILTDGVVLGHSMSIFGYCRIGLGSLFVQGFARSVLTFDPLSMLFHLEPASVEGS
jgi:hypothetical protein